MGLWFLPSYRRLDSLKRFFDACESTGILTGGRVLIDRDDWDENREGYTEIELRLPPGWAIEVGNGGSIGNILREAWQFHGDEDWVGLVTDDHIPESKNWDLDLLSRINGMNIVSSHDGKQAPQRMHGATIFSGDLLRAVGCLVPPGFQHMYIDDVWETLGRETGIWTTVESVMVRHAHASYGGKADQTTAKVNKFMASDQKTYRQWLAGDKNRAVEAIYALMESKGVKLFRPKLDGISLLIATPTGSGQYDRRYLNSLIQTIDTVRGCGGVINRSEMPYMADVALARAKLFGAFLRSDHTHMLMIDDDMGWDARDVLRLLEVKRDFVAIAGTRKKFPIEFAFNNMSDSGDELPWNIENSDPELIEVTHVGGAFVLITRACAERMVQHFPELAFEMTPGLTEYALFDPIIVNGKRKSEDFSFCHRWRQISGHIYLMPVGKLTHSGNYAWTASLAEVMQQRMAAE